MSDPQLATIRGAFDAAFLRMCAARRIEETEQELSNALHQLYRLAELGKKRLGKSAFYTNTRQMAKTRAALWARTMDTHDVVTTANISGVFTEYFTELFGVLSWKPLSSLSRAHDDHGRHLDYQKSLENKPVPDTIRVAFDDLFTLLEAT